MRKSGDTRPGDRVASVALWASAALLVAAAVSAIAVTGGATPDGGGLERPVSATELDAALQASPIGGGTAYEHTVSRADATVVVTNRTRLRAALDAAEPGDTVFVPGTARVNLTSDLPLVVPPGVTLASDRGVDGSDGALLYTTRGTTATPLLVAKDEARVTGLRLRGYGEGWTPAPRDEPRTHGIRVPETAANVTIDNNRITHFVSSCVAGEGDHLAVHNNYIAYCNQIGYGYGVAVEQRGLVACNYFDHTRHAVAAPGWPGNSYEARYNVVGPHVQSHAFDVHPPGGDAVEIHHNTVMATVRYNSNTSRVPSVRLRGVSARPSAIYANWFFQNASMAIWQGTTHGPPYDDSKYERLAIHDNTYGGNSSPPSVGAFGSVANSTSDCT